MAGNQGKSPAVAREIGKLGGRPKGSMSKAKLMMRELATRIVTDVDVQNRLLAQAKAGTLHPAVMRELFHYHGGRPPVKIEVAPASPRADELVARLRLLPRSDRLLLAEMSRRVLALPEKGDVIDVKREKKA